MFILPALSMFEKLEKEEKIHGQPRICSHQINARTLTGVCRAVRIFSSYYFHVFVSIGTLESDLLSLSTPSGTKWTLFYYD